MRKVAFLAMICLLFVGIAADAQPKKIAISSRISWCPGSNNQGVLDDRDFDVMYQYSMDDELMAQQLTQNGYFPVLMPDYVLQGMLMSGCPFPPGDDADFNPYINEGDYMDQPDFLTKDGFDLVYNTGTCWSSIGPPLKDLAIPVVQAEHANLGARYGKFGGMFMYTAENSGDINGDNTIVLTAAGQTHEITAGFPTETIIYGDGPEGPPANTSAAWLGIYDTISEAAPGVVPLAVWKSAPNKVAIAVMETGAAYMVGCPGLANAPARRAQTFWTGQVRPQNSDQLVAADWITGWEHMTTLGKTIHLRILQWAMGDLTPKSSDVVNWELPK